MTIPRAKLNGLLLMCELVPSTVNALRNQFIFSFSYSFLERLALFFVGSKITEIHKPYPQIQLNFMRKVIRDFSSLKLIPS